MAAQSCAGTALITAAAGGIGRAIATRLAPRWAIVLQESREFFAEAEELAQRLRAAGGRAAVVEADLGDVEATGRLVERAAAAAGPGDAPRQCGDAVRHRSRRFRRDLLGRPFCRQSAGALPARRCVSPPRCRPTRSGAIVNLVDRRLWQNEPAAAHLRAFASGAVVVRPRRWRAPMRRASASMRSGRRRPSRQAWRPAPAGAACRSPAPLRRTRSPRRCSISRPPPPSPDR